jgi:ketosteroid isomerase-like protein
MSQTTRTTETVGAFLDRYARALSEIDLDALADCYHYPALAVTRLGCQAITDPAQTREFFAANGAAYKARGIESVRITRPRASYDEDGLWVGLADLENLDGEGRHVGTEHNAYQLLRGGDGRWRIAVTTPLDVR